MGSAAPRLPCFDLNPDLKPLEQGSERWTKLCNSIREALEVHGFLLVKYDEIPRELREEAMGAAMNDLFDLPVETKHKVELTDPSQMYIRPDGFPHFESHRVTNIETPGVVEAYTKILWPEGNNHFSETLDSMTTKVLELNRIIMEMVLDGYGVKRCCDGLVVETDLRLNKYYATMMEEAVIGGWPHIDVSFLTILCTNDVEGLQIKSREGEWISVNPGDYPFIVLVGAAFRAWSNGRMYAPSHKVMISGAKDRFSYGYFSRPSVEQILEAPDELVDAEHPRMFKAFKFEDFLKHTGGRAFDENSLDAYVCEALSYNCNGKP